MVVVSRFSICSKPSRTNALKAALRVAGVFYVSSPLLVLAAGATDVVLCTLMSYYWYTAARLVVLGGIVIGGSLV